jgi:hypothetical protein
MYNFDDVLFDAEIDITLSFNAGEQLASGADGMISVTVAVSFSVYYLH